jgi:hypothetical protein
VGGHDEREQTLTTYADSPPPTEKQLVLLADLAAELGLKQVPTVTTRKGAAGAIDACLVKLREGRRRKRRQRRK